MPSVRMEIGQANLIKAQAHSVYVSFSYSVEAVANIKKLPEKVRKYIVKEKKWEVNVAYLSQLLEVYKDFEITLVGDVHTDIKDAPVVALRKEFIDTELKGFEFKTKPFDHQIDGLMYGKEHPKFLLGDDPGLGKTKQAIDLAVSRKGQFKHCLIVCGVSSVKMNWLKEIEVHSNERGHILGSYTTRDGRLKDDGPLEYRLDDLESDLDEFFLITNIETFRAVSLKRKESSLSKQELTQKRILERVGELTRQGKIGMVIIDEIHKAKNPSSKQGKAIHQLYSHYKMALTGTPLVNSPLDLYNILKWLEAEEHSYKAFKEFYCELGSWGDIEGYKNLDHLQAKLQGVMLRRLKKDVLDLPPKIRQVEYVQLKGDQSKLYDGIRDELIKSIDELVLSPNPLAMLTRLRQVTSYPQILSDKIKESAKFERLEEMLEQIIETGEKAIIFSNWSKVTKAVRERLAKYNPAYIDGETSDRMAEVNKFQDDPSCSVAIGTIGAMGTGLTMTAASWVFFLDKPWNATTRDQAEDRAYRIGTKGTVNVVTFVVGGSVDEKIEDIIQEKGELSDAIVDAKYSNTEKSSLLRRLLGM